MIVKILRKIAYQCNSDFIKKDKGLFFLYYRLVIQDFFPCPVLTGKENVPDL